MAENICFPSSPCLLSSDRSRGYTRFSLPFDILTEYIHFAGSNIS